jgi:hypothetical protein
MVKPLMRLMAGSPEIARMTDCDWPPVPLMVVTAAPPVPMSRMGLPSRLMGPA